MSTPNPRSDVRQLLDKALFDCPGLRFDKARENAIETMLSALDGAGLSIVTGFDTSNAPHPAVRDCVPLVLYFATRADADEMTAAVKEWKPGMVAHEVTP
jgi:hypothetical protein